MAGKKGMKRKPIPYEINHKYVNEVEYKLCSDCHEWKPMNIEHYYKNKANSVDGFHPYCKQCAKEKALDRYGTVRLQDNIRRKEWYENNKEHTIKRQKITNEKNKESNKINQTKWRRENKDKLREYRTRRALHKDHDIDEYELSKLYEYANSSCMYCGMSEEESLEKFNQKLHRDHAYDLGSDEIDNCILACKSCNGSKRDKDWDIWYTPDNPKYDEDRYEAVKVWLELWM